MESVLVTSATIDVASRQIPHRLSVIGSVSSADEAAAARGVAVSALIKSIVIRRSEDNYLFVLVPGDRAIDWSKLRAELGVSRLSLPSAEEAFAVTGYVRGTITPFGSSTAWPVVIDERLVGLGEVAIGGGGGGIGIHLEPAALVDAFDARVADVTKAG
ncbi:MAG: YbaK/EbsC family protein [Acidimicrobiia bacterium]|nr:YbaK/EbsC family protein [Acidimicrobiia bacterium]